MKNILAFSILLGLFAACTVSEPHEYLPESDGLKVKTVKVGVNFGWKSEEFRDDTLEVNLELIGYTSEEDRYFEFTPVDSVSTLADENWDIVDPLFLPADSTTCSIRIAIERPEEIAGLDTTLTLLLVLDGLDNFDTYTGQSGVELWVEDLVGEPDWWTYNSLDVYYWGRYHIDVLNYMVDLWDIDTENVNDFDIQSAINDFGKFYSDMKLMQIYFEENPSYHDDGTRVVIPVQ